MNIRNQFSRNVIPSMLAFAFSGIYAIVDGWFVGRNIGDAGLAAINIAYPIQAIVQAVGTGIGMGGSIQIAVSMGKGDGEEEDRFFGNTMLLLLGACFLTTLLLSLFHLPLLKAFGAEGITLAYGTEYIKIILLGAAFQVIGTGLVPVIRNCDGAVAAMAAMMGGFVTNVFLDWLFISVLSYGIAGAAWATIIGQMVTMLPCVFFLLIKGKMKNWSLLKPIPAVLGKILSVGLSPFGLTLSPNIVIIILNKGALAYGGAQAVACYAVVSYVVCVIQLLLQGVGDGSQPLIGRYYGAGEKKSVRTVVKMAYFFAFALAMVCMTVIFLLRERIPQFFGVSKEVATEVSRVLPVFLAGFLFAAFLRITTAYFYAVKKNSFAYILIYGEPVLLGLLVFFVLPFFWGLYGVWTAVPVTQAVLAVVGGLLAAKSPKHVPGRVKTLT